MHRVFPFDFGGNFDFLNSAGKPILLTLTGLIVLGIISKVFGMVK